MARRILPLVVVTALAGAVAFWVITRPAPVEEAPLVALTGDTAAGELVFHASGCASCHAAEGAAGDDKLILSGGRAFRSPFGTFHAPNISPDRQQGIGGWSLTDFANAIQRGIGPGRENLYPALPYTSYVHMRPQDVADLHAYMMTLPASAAPNLPHDIDFPFSQRWLVGGWKLLFFDRDWVVTAALTPEEERGRYLVEALGHCGECHTPRGELGQMKRDAWLAGGPDPANPNRRIPNITPAKLTWSVEEIADYLQSGFTSDFDIAGGEMAQVVEEMARLPASDRLAIAAYLKKVPPVE